MRALPTHAACAILAALLLLSAGQPLFTEDAWWHLSMGAAYAAHGPRLEADPLLHTATGPPAPAAWLADLTLYGVERAFGFHGLRVFHAAVVAAILALGWCALRRTSGSRVFASAGTMIFGAVAAYRLFQLRPELFSVLATLLAVRWLVADGSPPSWRRIAAAAALAALWVNLHAGFVLGPVLIAAAAAGAAVQAAFERQERGAAIARARRLAAACAIVAAATTINPEGATPHGLYFAAGVESPELGVVADEWAGVDLFALPAPAIPPSPLSWALAWAAVLATLTFVAAVAVRRSWPRGADPALAALAVVGIAAMLFAVRFSWLGILPIWFAASVWGGRAPDPSATTRARVLRLGIPVGAVAFAVAFVLCGDWPMISRGVHSHTYVKPYPPLKYHAHAVWFLRDTGVEGNLWNDYASGNFLGYWLAPTLRVFVNGSLNVPIDVMKARHAIERGGFGSGISLTEWLDRYDVDVFFGTGLPDESATVRGTPPTTALLEAHPEWVPVFRNLDSAVYLRRGERNAGNLARVARYYREAGVPFDPERGLEVGRVLAVAPAWAADHGLVPYHFAQLRRAARSLDPVRGAAARVRLGLLYAALGLYERAEAVDEQTLRRDPRALPAARRRLWCLLHLGRWDEALAAASVVDELSLPDDRLSRSLVSGARLAPTLSANDAAALAATLPVFTVSDSQWIYAGYRPPVPRIPE